MPWRMAAANTGSSALAWNWRPLGSIWIWNVILARLKRLVAVGTHRGGGLLAQNRHCLKFKTGVKMNGALPAVFRRQRILVVGCGDIGQRAAALLGGGRKIRLLALTSSPERVPALRAQGLRPLLGNLDQPATLRRLSGLATRVLHLAPPPTENLPDWRRDPRTLALLRALRLRSLLGRFFLGVGRFVRSVNACRRSACCGDTCGGYNWCGHQENSFKYSCNVSP